jgi:hypothetical protein
MKQPKFDSTNRLVCPLCLKSDNVVLEWSNSDNIHGEHEDVFMCDGCRCVFTAVYEVKGIEVIGEGEKQNA